jgi:hypothetical protein
MALKLMDPVYNQIPFFQPNQVLTYSHLNKLAGYLYQQERYTRNKLIGNGIVCGLTFDWKAAGTYAQVIIEAGCAITSAGYLIVFNQPVAASGTTLPYTHKRPFLRLKDIEPFKNVPAIDTKTVYELLTIDQANAETEVPVTLLNNADRNNNVLVLLFDIETLNMAKCLDESCDDKGKLYQYTPRPLLVPVSVIDDAKVLGLTEEGRGWKGTEKKLELTYLGVANLFRSATIKISNITNNTDLQNLFLGACEANGYLNTVKVKINSLISAYPWVLKKQLECMIPEVTGLSVSPVNLGDLFKSKVLAFKASGPLHNYSQYLYDYIRDVADCYNDLYTVVTDLAGECGGNEFLYPFHVLLGIPQSKDTLACYEEQKYNEANYKYRSYFVPSPVIDSQVNLYEKVQHTLKRLVRVVAFFNLDVTLKAIKVIPGKDYDDCIGIRPIPYYYDSARFENFYRIWNYDSTRHNKVSNPRGYHGSPPQDQTDLLRNDTRKIDFYRIEGHIEQPFSAALTALDSIRNDFNLPFRIAAVPLQQEVIKSTCSFPDLEEEFNYFRDRALGYIRELIFWFEQVRQMDAFPALDKKFEDHPNQIFERLNKIYEILLKIRCIEHFEKNYSDYTGLYTGISESIFRIYSISLSQNLQNASQFLNGIQNVWNTVFFRPLYRIIYFYKYRMMLINSKTKLKSLSELAKQHTGLEHLAGVRRGEVFMMVYDKTQADKVVADFNIPQYPQCECDCQLPACTGENQAIVKPLEKPVIMVVDPAKMDDKEKPGNGRFYARYDFGKQQFVLELDSMGFYKGDSTIKELVVVQKGEQYPNIESEFRDEKFIFRYTLDKEVIKTGVITMLSYIMKGDFEEEVEGMFMLVILGLSQKPDLTNNYDYPAAASEPAKPYYPYDKKIYKEYKPDIIFADEFKVTPVGDIKVPVYTTPKGNEVAIMKDKVGLPFFKVIKATTGDVEEIPYYMETNGIRTKASFKLNVISDTEELQNSSYAGKILDESGNPVENARIITSEGKEVFSDTKGEFNLAGLKKGEVITVERLGFSPTSVQANSQMAAEIRVQKTGILGIKELANIKLPDSLSNLGAGIDMNIIKDIFK